jgi:hypothetical protein
VLGRSSRTVHHCITRRKTARDERSEHSVLQGLEVGPTSLDFLGRLFRGFVDIEYQVSYISKLADFMAAVPLSQVTKPVLYDFYQEEHIHARSRESHVDIMRAAISLDAFRADKRRKKKPKAEQ